MSRDRAPGAGGRGPTGAHAHAGRPGPPGAHGRAAGSIPAGSRGRVAGGTLAAALLAVVLLAPVPASAHGLSVFASAEDGVVLVEARFSGGGPVREGTVRVYDARDRLVLTMPLAPDGTARFELGERRDGLRVEVDAGDGHSDYWILTPADLGADGPPS